MRIMETKDIRSSNRVEIMQTILRKKSIPRVNVASETGLNKATVSTIVKELIDLDLIEETELGSSSGGRRPIMIIPKVDVGYTVAIDVNINNVQLLVFNLNNEVISSDSMKYQTRDFTVFFTLLCRLIDKAVNNLPPSKFGLVGIGVAVRGVVDLAGKIKFIPKLDWRNIEISDLLIDRYKVAVLVENDGNFSAIAEQCNYPDVKNLIVIDIDDVITSGIICNGEVVKGYLGFANVVGHHVIDYKCEQVCSCGKRGCLEQFCSNRVILGQINEYEKVDTIEEFISLVKNKNINALKVLEYFVEHLTIGISNMIFLLNSEVIILNSPILDEFPYLLEHINERLLLPITKVQRIELSTLQKKAPLVGASARVVEEFFKVILSNLN